MLTELPDITLRLLESAANDPESELLLEARDEIERLRKSNLAERARNKRLLDRLRLVRGQRDLTWNSLRRMCRVVKGVNHAD